MPLVSVILPAYNAADTIARAIRSVAAQTYPHLELIVIDDSSTDDTAAVAARAADIPVKLERLPRTGGAANARNHGMGVSRGQIIAFLDADDEWLPEKTALQVNALSSDETLSFVTCEAAFLGAGGEDLGLINASRARAQGAEAWKTLLQHPCIATPCVMLRRETAQAAGGFDAALAIGEDQDFWIRLALKGPVRHLPDVLVRVHDRPRSLSKREYSRTAAITLPMILRHLDAQRGRLSEGERRVIRAHRYSALGRNAYAAGQWREGGRLLVRAALLGHRPAQTCAFLLLASPPARALKQWARTRLLPALGL